MRRESTNEFEGHHDDGHEGGDPRKKSFSSRRKGCRFCGREPLKIDFKDPLLLASFITERGKIVPRRISGNCSLHQRGVAQAIKRARFIALLSYTDGFHPGSMSEGATP